MKKRVLKAAVLAATTSVLLLAMFWDFEGPKLEVASSAETSDAGANSPAPIDKPDGHEAKMLAGALKKKPDHTPVLMRLATLASQEGRSAEARKHLEDVLRNEPENQDARLELGKLLYETGDVAGAIEQTRRILKGDPDSPDALYNLGAIYGNVGNRDLALQHWERLIARAPETESGRRAKQMIGQLKGAATGVQ
jgi:tetratricopeptide (TPR) repeat protein